MTVTFPPKPKNEIMTASPESHPADTTPTPTPSKKAKTDATDTKKEEMNTFLALFEELKGDVVADMKRRALPADAVAYVERVRSVDGRFHDSLSLSLSRLHS